MKYIITESQSNKLTNSIQKLINITLDQIREESEDWGLGEMEELDEVQSIDKIEIDRINSVDGIKVYVNIIKNSNRNYFDNIRAEIQYRIKDIIPNIKIFIENVIDERTFGIGIDW